MLEQALELKVLAHGALDGARLTSWFVEDGEVFCTGDVLCELEVDDRVTVIAAEADGILLRRLVAESDNLKVGQLIALQAPAATPRAQIDQLLAAITILNPAVKPLPTKSNALAIMPEATPLSRQLGKVFVRGTGIRMSPWARRLAKQHGIDPALVEGTGPMGRICGDDILAEVALRTKAEGREEIPAELMPS